MEQNCELGSYAKGFLAMTTILFILTAVLIPMRMMVRIRIVKGFGWDDSIILIAYFLSIGTSAMFWRASILGFGQPAECLDLSQLESIGEHAVILEAICLMSMTFCRLSIVLFVLRILGSNRWFRYFLCGWAIYMTIQQLIMAGLAFGFCTPIKANWDPEAAKTAYCWSPGAIFVITIFDGATSVLSDLILALTPIHFLYKLQLPLRKRLGLAVLMALGLIPAACAIGRTIYLVEAQPGYNPRTTTVLFIFGALEMYMLLICASIPTVIPLYHKLRYGSKSSTDQQYLRGIRSTRVVHTGTTQKTNASSSAQSIPVRSNKLSMESSAEALQAKPSMRT